MVSVVAASVGPAGVFTLFAALFNSSGLGSTPFVVFVAAALVSAAHAVVFGLPVALALLRSGRFQFLPMLVAGFVIGSFPSVAVLGVQHATSSDSAVSVWPFVQLAAVTGGLGCIGAAAFFSVGARLLVEQRDGAA